MMKNSSPALSPDLGEFLELLNKNNVNYIVVGAWAVALHGRPRYTKDIDVLIARNPTNAKNIVTAINEFGFGAVGLGEEDFLKPNFVIQLGFEPNRIDILTAITGVTFAEVEKNKITKYFQNIPVPLISRADLIKAKQAAGRPQDLADIASLEQLAKSKK